MYGIQTGFGLYLPGQGHEHTGPGTSMVQRINWTNGQEIQNYEAHDSYGMGCCCQERGLGLFDSGLDWTGWGAAEWITAALVGYVALSTVFTTQRATRSVRKVIRKHRARKAVMA